jgi:hypothetical protein
MTLDGLNPTNTFERKLLDVLVEMVRTGAPIPVQVTGERYDDTAIIDRLSAVEMLLSQCVAHIKQLEADHLSAETALLTHTHEALTVRSEAA